VTTGDDANITPGEPAATERVETTAEQLRAIHVQPLVPLNGPIYLAEYDPAWPRLFAREAGRIRAALGERVRLLEHAGSTSVPGLAAKPRIDIVLAVPDSADEAAYLPALQAVGYVLAIREPEWFEHRVCKGPDTDVNLHIFSDGCPEIARMLRFRDWLRTHDDDRQLYERTKRELARRTWQYTQHYADAKTEVVRAILARAEAEK
jgi:GrpB-like predicted nucleotidyltransferase (UPF0157 family)